MNTIDQADWLTTKQMAGFSW